MDIAAFIPARSRSTRVPDKNIREIEAIPMVCWTVQQAIQVARFSQVFFSSDSHDYLNIVRDFFPEALKDGRLVCHHRDPSDASNTSKIFDVLRRLSTENLFLTSHVCLMLPTAPVRRKATLEKVLNHAATGHSSRAFCAAEYEFPTGFAFVVDNASGEPWTPVYDGSPMQTGNTQSHVMAKHFHPTGTATLLDVPYMKTHVPSAYIGSHPVLIDRLQAIDVDTLDDFQLLQSLWGQLGLTWEDPWL